MSRSRSEAVEAVRWVGERLTLAPADRHAVTRVLLNNAAANAYRSGSRIAYVTPMQRFAGATHARVLEQILAANAWPHGERLPASASAKTAHMVHASRAGASGPFSLEPDAETYARSALKWLTEVGHGRLLTA